MTINFAYSDIQEQCKKLAAFDANQAHTSEGDSLFDLVRIADRDMVVISDYITQAFHIIESSINNLLTEEGNHDIKNETYSWNFKDDVARRKTGTNNAFTTAATEAITMYALSRWMENKLPDNAKMYNDHFTTALNTAVRIIKIKAEPTRPE